MGLRSIVAVVRSPRQPLQRAAVALALSLAAAASRPDAADREWIAEFDQPCDGAPVGSYVFEVIDRAGGEPRDQLVVEATGCGPQSMDISGLVPSVDPNDLSPPVLRVWSVSVEGVRSEAFDWVLVDPEPDCAGQTRTSDDGDANDDASRDISDAIAILSYLFSGGTRPCTNAADVNNDGEVDLADAAYILDRLFGTGQTMPRTP